MNELIDKFVQDLVEILIWVRFHMHKSIEIKKLNIHSMKIVSPIMFKFPNRCVPVNLKSASQNVCCYFCDICFVDETDALNKKSTVYQQ